MQRRCGGLRRQQQPRIEALSLQQLEALPEALLDVQGAEDLTAWLEGQERWALAAGMRVSAAGVAKKSRRLRRHPTTANSPKPSSRKPNSQSSETASVKGLRV